MMKTLFLLLLGLVFLCQGLKGDENENEDSIVLDEDDEEIPNELDEIEDGATVEDEAEDPGTRRCFRRCRRLSGRRRRCRCRCRCRCKHRRRPRRCRRRCRRNC